VLPALAAAHVERLKYTIIRKLDRLIVDRDRQTVGDPKFNTGSNVRATVAADHASLLRRGGQRGQWTTLELEVCQATILEAPGEAGGLQPLVESTPQRSHRVTLR
jgi:hypothetical protein